MYNLREFKATNETEVLAFMKQHPFAMLIGNADNKAFATQFPLLFDERDGRLILIGHMMRKQDHHLVFEKNPEVLVVFTGPHTYVSATWYKDPHQASTWNYSSVHVRGKISFLNQQGLEDALQKLSSRYEGHNPHSTTVFENLPIDYRTGLMKAVIAFEIEVNTIEHVFKLSQNRDEKSYDSIANELKKQTGDAKEIAALMEKRKDKVFDK